MFYTYSFAINMNIINSSYTISAPRLELCPYHDYTEIAFIGRSNVGKSSLINAVTRNKSLAKTSSTPGKTRLINFFVLKTDTTKTLYCVDLPGYGYAKISKTQRQQWVDASSEYISKRKQLKHLFILLDYRHKPQAVDLEFITWVIEQGIEFSVIATKADKLNQKERSQQQKIYSEFANALQLTTPIIVTSAQTGQGIDQVLTIIHAAL